MAKRKWTKVSNTYPKSVDWKEVEVVEGKIIDKKTLKIDDEDRSFCIIHGVDNNTVTVWISAGLRDLYDFPIGAMVLIKNGGLKVNPKTKRAYRAFEIFYDATTISEPY